MVEKIVMDTGHIAAFVVLLMVLVMILVHSDIKYIYTMKKYLFCMILCMGAFSGVKAQIGYQVSLLNTATGDPRANVTANATLTITNSKNEVIYTGTQTATSNDFGVLSLTVGNAETFKNVDFGKLPFFIEVSVDGQLIGKSQILNVPVAEAAYQLVPVMPIDELCKKVWAVKNTGYYTIMFSPDMTGIKYYDNGENKYEYPFRYTIQGNIIYILYKNNSEGFETFGIFYEDLYLISRK